jgi:selenide, water dikinase
MNAAEKRKRVMTRSIRLGHCVCDPRQPCPCDLFKAKNICSCAGEREGVEASAPVAKLTDFVRSAGCASKIGQKDLHRVLNMLPKVEDPRLLVGTSTADDAGVFQLTDDVTIVQTVDVFTPGIDDAYRFGRIAACNSLSDVYAMGGKPLTALSVIGFPIYSLPHEVMADILRGGMDVLSEAGAIMLGGHSINDEEVKFGLAVTGIIDRKNIMTNANAQPGDCLVLTKPLGTGIISLAHKIDRAPQAAMDAVTDSMATLNRTAAELMVECGSHACTDITGFGLLGHLGQMVVESGVTAEIHCETLPLFEGVLDYAAEGTYSGANERNAEHVEDRLTFVDDVPEAMRAVLFDAQTSGGLLVSIPEEAADEYVSKLHKAGVSAAAIVGRITEASEGRIELRMGSMATAGDVTPAPPTTTEEPTMTETTEATCCSHSSEAPEQAIGMFQNFMGTAMQPGAVDVVTKELMAVALGLAVGCVPCVKIHLKKSRQMGISEAELEEAAALATAFAGCRALMLWKELKG